MMMMMMADSDWMQWKAVDAPMSVEGVGVAISGSRLSRVYLLPGPIGLIGLVGHSRS